MGYIWYTSSTHTYKQCLRVGTYVEHFNSTKNLVKNRVFCVFNREKSLFFNFLTYGIVVLEGSYAIYLVYELKPDL